MYSEVTALATSLSRLGVRKGDRVVAIARNSVEVVVAALATAAIGAVFSSCSQDMGAFAILTRFAPLAPVVLFGSLRPEPWDPGIPIAARLVEVAAGLPSLAAIVALDDAAFPNGLARPPVHRLTDLTRGGVDRDFAWQRNRVQPSAVHSVLVGHDRTTEVYRAWYRWHLDGTHQGAPAAL